MNVVFITMHIATCDTFSFLSGIRWDIVFHLLYPLLTRLKSVSEINSNTSATIGSSNESDVGMASRTGTWWAKCAQASGVLCDRRVLRWIKEVIL